MRIRKSFANGPDMSAELGFEYGLDYTSNLIISLRVDTNLS